MNPLVLLVPRRYMMTFYLVLNGDAWFELRFVFNVMCASANAEAKTMEQVS
jgi:hypothetical protein